MVSKKKEDTKIILEEDILITPEVTEEPPIVVEKPKEPEEKKEEKKAPTETIIIRENGEIRIGTAKDLDGKNEWYTLRSKHDGIVLLDYDQTKIRPYIKDILNRQNMFIEIKLLRFVLYALALLFFMIFWILGFVLMKATTASDIEKIQKTITTEVAKTVQKQVIPPYIPPTETPIIRKNIPSNVSN